MLGAGRGRFRSLPVNSLAPNILTVLALCAGLTAMRFALLDRWQLAVAAVIVAAVLDGLDGRLARLLKGATKFGAELDSLSDFVSFGVAPVFVLYLWTLKTVGGIGWIVVLIFAICCALRLARFNTALDDPNQPSWQSNFFTGIPAPAGAGLVLLFIYISFELGDTFWRSPILNAPWTLVIAFLMVSRLPSFSFKKVHVRRDWVLPMLLAVAGMAAALVSFPWYTLSALSVVYLATLPFAFRTYQRLARDHFRMPPALTAGAEAEVLPTEEA
ncbi:MAG TPA: phosphatidylcholine/phosphatidylserine synthase [Candidatus Cybelea sp.]|nr:phosphatidylcholine/phosphatidylserine synthase [Candidatus Cybelea sp.]